MTPADQSKDATANATANATATADVDTGPTPPSLAKLAIDLGPLLVFFAANYKLGILYATVALMVATVAALIASRVLLGKVSTMPLVTAVLVVVFGGLTLWLQDEKFIKLKPTIINAALSAVLFAGLAFGKPLLSHVLGEALRLTHEGWRILTLRWAVFFAGMAGLNEVVWRSVSTDTWVTFKVFGLIGLTLVFAMAQMGVVRRHARIDQQSETRDRSQHG